jgi:hypothetical protein
MIWGSSFQFGVGFWLAYRKSAHVFSLSYGVSDGRYGNLLHAKWVLKSGKSRCQLETDVSVTYVNSGSHDNAKPCSED